MIGTTESHRPACTLLVVAGNADTQAVILEHAKAKGHSVISASTPALGLSTFDMMQPDIVVTDLFLPELEGIGLVKQIRERRPTCPVVLLTDARHSESGLKGVRVGVLDYLQQPIDAEAFAQVLQRAIHGLPASVDDAPGGEPAWRLLHIYGDGYDSCLLEYKADGRIGPAGGG